MMTYDTLIELIKNGDTNDCVFINNLLCSFNHWEGLLYDTNSEFDEVLSSYTALEVAYKAFFGHSYNPYTNNNKEPFYPCDDWFTLDAYANLVSVRNEDVFKFCEYTFMDLLEDTYNTDANFRFAFNLTYGLEEGE